MIRPYKLCTKYCTGERDSSQENSIPANDCFRLSTRMTGASDTISTHFVNVKRVISFCFVR
jgi:hypothetical protein